MQEEETRTREEEMRGNLLKKGLKSLCRNLSSRHFLSVILTLMAS